MTDEDFQEAELDPEDDYFAELLQKGVKKYGRVAEYLNEQNMPEWAKTAILQNALANITTHKFHAENEKEAKKAEAVAPDCPSCKIPMRLTNRKDGSGKFWGCKNYFSEKKCMEKIDYKEDSVGGSPSQAAKPPEPARSSPPARGPHKEPEDMRKIMGGWITKEGMERIPPDYYGNDNTITLLYEEWRLWTPGERRTNWGDLLRRMREGKLVKVD